MSIPILRHTGATINLTRLVDSFNARAEATASTAAFYVLDLPASPYVDVRTWFRSMFGPPAVTPTIIAPDGICCTASHALPGTEVYAYSPRDWSVRLWAPVCGENGKLRNVDRYRTAKEAFGAFEAMCSAIRCSECRFDKLRKNLGINCHFLWLYEDANKENAK